jgi:CTP:molybdopterin cytidylyltransferase MocA
VIAAVVLAAGASSRMGTPKAALPLGPGHTVLSRGLAALVAADLPRIVVVAGAHPDTVRVAQRLADPRIEIVEHQGWRAGQLTSLLAGLAHVDSPDLEALVMTLVDVPLVSPGTVREVIRVWRHTRAPIVRPARGDEHGHPVVFDRAVFDDLRAADPATGAKSVVRACADRIVNVPVDDEGAFADLDTPDDYERLKRMV